MCPKSIDPRTIDERAILEIVAGKNDHIGRGVVRNMATDTESETTSLDSSQLSYMVSMEQYKIMFFHRQPIVERKSLHIDAALHRRISALVEASGNSSVSVSGFICRVLAEHLERYVEPIGAIFEEHFKLLKTP